MKSSVLALALAATAALPEVEPRLRGTKDDEHRVGGRKPSFGHHDGFPGLQIQDGDAYSLNFQGPGKVLHERGLLGKDCWGEPTMCPNGFVCIQRCTSEYYQYWWSRTTTTRWYHCCAKDDGISWIRRRDKSNERVIWRDREMGACIDKNNPYYPCSYCQWPGNCPGAGVPAYMMEWEDICKKREEIADKCFAARGQFNG
mmetsp:Transcript_2607/g.7925  ORF Transcript_2607/g.7925 Transcript_2607/m.7925 type:complete len:200 (-) Transcript_2607:21-620(-)